MGSACLLALLSALVVEKKLTRSYSEWASHQRRRRYRAALRDGSREELTFVASEARRQRAAQEDLAVVLEAEYALLTHERRVSFHGVVRETRLDRALMRGLRSGAAVKRGRAALLVARLRLPGAELALEPLLHDPDPDVQLTCVHGLGLLETDAAARALLGALDSRAVAPERIVERLGAPWAVDALLAAFRDPALAGSRGWIAEALGLSGDQIAQTPLTELLAWGALEERVQACRALARVGGASVVPALIDALGDDFWAVRAQAARGLVAIPDERALGALEQGLADESWWVRANCGQALRMIRPAGTEVLWRALDNPDRYASERAFEALAVEAAYVAREA